jgi:Tfp pilus assembly protein PilW
MIAQSKTSTRPARTRKGVSFIEVMAGLVLVSILFVPTFGILSASGRVWYQFEGGHAATTNRQMAMQEIDRRLSSATKIESYLVDEFVFADKTGAKHRILRRQRTAANGQFVFDLVQEPASGAGQTETLAENIGVFRVTLISKSPKGGELLELRIENIVDPKVTTNRNVSSRRVWKRA